MLSNSLTGPSLILRYITESVLRSPSVCLTFIELEEEEQTRVLARCICGTLVGGVCICLCVWVGEWQKYCKVLQGKALHNWNPSCSIQAPFKHLFVWLTLNSWILMASTCFCSSSLFFVSAKVSFVFCHSVFSLSENTRKMVSNVALEVTNQL